MMACRFDTSQTSGGTALGIRLLTDLPYDALAAPSWGHFANESGILLELGFTNISPVIWSPRAAVKQTRQPPGDADLNFARTRLGIPEAFVRNRQRGRGEAAVGLLSHLSSPHAQAFPLMACGNELTLVDLQPQTACSRSCSCAGAVVLGLTGDLFAVALLLLSNVAAVLTTDWTTVGIRADPLSRRHTHLSLRFAGISRLVLALRSFRPCEHARLDRCARFPSFLEVWLVQSASVQLSGQGQVSFRFWTHQNLL